MLHGVTEQVELILSQTEVQLGRLSGKTWKPMFRALTVKQQHAREAMNILSGRRSDQDGATAVGAPTPTDDITTIDEHEYV